MEIIELRKKLLNYIKNSKNGKVPSRYEFAKVSGYTSFKAMQRDLATKGDEGRDFLEELDNEIQIFLIQFLADSKKQSEVLVRKHLLSLAGLQEKNTLEIGLNPIDNGTANIDFALLARVNKVANKEVDLIEEAKNE